MMTLAAFSLLAGMALGQRFKVIVLLPTAIVACLLVAGLGVARANEAWTIAYLALVSILCLQVGYLAGIGVRYVPVALRASRRQAEAASGSMSTRHAAH
jgi:hypothetical protein